MAIQLARAIGLQGGIPQSNVPQIIQKIGTDIASGIERAGERKEKKALKDQALKDAIAANIKIDTGEATPEDNAERENYIKTTVPELAISQQTDSPSDYQKKVDDFIFGLKERNRIYKNNWDAIAKATELSKTHHMKDFEDYLYKGTPSVEKTFGVDTEAIDKQIAEYEASKQKDLSSATDDEQKANINESYDSVINKLKEQKNQPQQKEIIQGEGAYFKLPFEEKKKIDLNKKLEEKVLPMMPNALDVAKGLFTPTFSAGDYVTRTTTAKQGYQFSKDEKAIERDAEAFGDYIANPPLAPTKEYVPMHRNLLKQVMDDLSGKYTQKYLEEHPEEIKETVKKLAKKKFMDEANREADAQMIRKKQEIEKGKGGGMTFNFGQAEKNSRYSLPEQPLPEKMKYFETGEIRDYEYYPIQGKGEGSNKLTRFIANYGNVAVEGVYKNAKTNKIDFIKIVVPAKTKKNRDSTVEEVEPAKIKYVKPSGRELAEIATEVGDTYFYGRTKAERPTSETIPTKKKEGTKPAEKQDYGTRLDGTPKGKGYFGELKMNDGSGKVATEISVKFDDVLGGAEIPTLVPTLSESEKQYLLKGNKPTKEIELKAIKHAEERASKGLSPFVDGGELKSKSGKPIYWDKTAKTYKYK